jgi:demethylmenaquinone methyltransferase/2-methoxy-6-polyprenyl-1,4-benzoquinol methylase
MQNPLHLDGQERARAVRGMFTRLAKRYDLMNRLMTGGQDVRWRREVIRRARLAPGGSLLDLGAGTGDLTGEALRQVPACRVVAADFTLAMLRVGKSRLTAQWCAADALCLPFPDETFDAVVSGFLMRNVVDIRQSLVEQRRALRPGGRIVILDTTRPQRGLLWPFIWAHLNLVIPLLGRVVAGQGEAYQYLRQSTEDFIRAEELAAHMAAAGFKQVGFQRRMFGTIALHWGEK